MSEHMGILLKVWPLTADRHGIWLLDDDAWCTDDRVPADADVFDEAEAILWRRGIGKSPEICQGCFRPGMEWYPDGRVMWCPSCEWEVSAVNGCATLLHSTSWHQDGPNQVDTFVAVVDVPGEFVISTWPNAKPISPELFSAVGDPAPHGAADPPEVRDIDSARHAVRHLVFLRAFDAGAREVLGGHWATHLADLTPALAGMYGAGVRPVELAPEPC